MALSRSPTLRLVINRRDIQKAGLALAKVANAESRILLDELSRSAVRMLAAMELAAGHPYLATQWTSTPAQPGSAGGWRTEVYSRVESMVFDNRSGTTGKRSTEWPVSGEKLLRWLEGGVSPHEITPRTPGKMLWFKVQRSVSASKFLGTAITEKGVEIGKHLGGEFNDQVVTRAVKHPGFAGNRFVAVTRTLMELEVQRRAAAAARRIAMRMK